MRHLRICAAIVILATLFARYVGAQVLNASFAKGAPSGWTLSGGIGFSRDSLCVTGNGDDSSYWQTQCSTLEAGATYRISFRARLMPGSTSGTVISGPEVCNRDYGLSQEWQQCGFVFALPDPLVAKTVRLGQWHLKGTVSFSDVRIDRVEPIYSRHNALVLGEGESIRNGVYQFIAPYFGEASNASRPLEHHTASFNSNRWGFGAGSEVTYRHELSGAEQLSGKVNVSLTYHITGSCDVSASADGKNWVPVGGTKNENSSTLQLPASLFPAKTIWVRLKASNGALFQVDGYGYSASLSKQTPDFTGSTRYLKVLSQIADCHVQTVALGDLTDPLNSAATLRVTSVSSTRYIVTLTRKQAGRPEQSVIKHVYVYPGTTLDFTLPGRLEPIAGPYRIRTKVVAEGKDGKPYIAESDGTVPSFLAEDYGLSLPSRLNAALWYCESDNKVAATRSAPKTTSAAIQMYGAGGERVHTQLVLRPNSELGVVRISTAGLSGPGGATIPSSAILLRRAAYVHVEQPTDAIGVAGDWPDPLPPLTKDGWKPAIGRNNPVWVTINLPRGARPGDYRGTILITTSQSSQRVPLQLHVYGFDLPAHTSLRSGFGISPDSIRKYHHLQNNDQLKQVWDLYMRDFAAHRLCCYNPMALAEIGVEAIKGDQPGVRLDFRAFDEAAHRYLDLMAFNSFTIGVQGMGTGRYPSYDQGSFLGHAADSPEYDLLMRDYGKRLEEHLASKGWLKKAYVYWYDEPEPNDYPFVVKGMDRLKKYFPRLTRMLTEGFREPLYASVQLWCPITPKFEQQASAARQQKGEEVWWYVCTGPKEPWCGLFIDHPGIEMRMWMWQTWKYQVQGVLIWETCWWTSTPQFKNHDQNPWQDAMSYTSESSGVWGNGDGRMFYPPEPNGGTEPIIAAPIDSIRWEQLGKGVQDWEYFGLLKAKIKQAESQHLPATILAQARTLLSVPDSICKDMTHFTQNGRLLDQQKQQVAMEIEKLTAILPVGSR